MRRALALVTLGLALPTSCGGDPLPCTTTLDNIAHRIYVQESQGRIVTAARTRIASSKTLKADVKRDDAPAAKAELRRLSRGQIKRIEIERDGHPFVALGHAAALAPVHGKLGAHAAYTLSVAPTTATLALMHELTGEPVTLGRHGQVPVTRYPNGHAAIALHPSCTQTTQPDTLVAVAERLLHAEATSAHTREVLRLVAGDPRFAAAVAHDDPRALRARIVHFFRDPRLHVVRIRATDVRGRLVNDVGGPYVLAPASRSVRYHGRTVGKVTLSIQDDAGYIKLLRRFTGAGVVLRSAAGVVPGSTAGGDQVGSFMARAFPSGPLKISVLSR